MSNHKPSQSFIDAYNKVRETPIEESHNDHLVHVEGYGRVTPDQAHKGAEHHTSEAARHASAGAYGAAMNHLRFAAAFISAAAQRGPHNATTHPVSEEAKSDDVTVRAHSVSVTLPDGTIKREVVLATGEKAAGRKAQKSAPRGAKVTDARVAEEKVDPDMGRVASKFKRNQRMNSKKRDKEKQDKRDDK